MAAESTRLVARVSAPPKQRSESSTARSTPRAQALRRVASVLGGPHGEGHRLKAELIPQPQALFQGMGVVGVDDEGNPLPHQGIGHWSICTWVVSGTCLIQATMYMLGFLAIGWCGPGRVQRATKKPSGKITLGLRCRVRSGHFVVSAGHRVDHRGRPAAAGHNEPIVPWYTGPWADPAGSPSLAGWNWKLSRTASY